MKIELLNENTNRIETLEFESESMNDELLNYFKDYQIKSIKWSNYGVICSNLDWIIDNNNDYDIPFLEGLSTEELYNILEELDCMSLDVLQKAQDIAEYEEISVFEVNIERFEDEHNIFNSHEEYYDFCDEVLKDCNSDFFNSNLSRYFDYKSFHNDCDYDCYVGSNGYVII